MSVQVHVPSVPRALRITQGMWEDFLCDPVMAARCLLGLRLDAFQAARLRYYWWVPHLIDSSGYSSGKTLVTWAYIQLRCVLIPDHHCGVYYPIFETGKNTFWLYYQQVRNPIFRAQLGGLEDVDDRKGDSKESGCWKARFRNGSMVFMPAPSFMKQAATQASMRFNTLHVEEWTHIDASVQPGQQSGIDAQLNQRATRPSFNQWHPIWSNHLHYSAPAKPRQHPGYRRYRTHERKAQAGDPRWGVISYSHKDFSDLPSHTGKSFKEEFRIESNIAAAKASMQPSDWLGEGLGIWGSSGTAMYPEEALDSCVALGRAMGLVPVTCPAEESEVRA